MGRKKSKELSDDNLFLIWKCMMLRYYDWLINHTLDHRPLCLRWGPRVKPDYELRFHNQLLYLSYKADKSAHGTLIVARCHTYIGTTASLAQYARCTQGERWKLIKEYKTITTPGEVKRIRELPQDETIVATLNDSCEGISETTSPPRWLRVIYAGKNKNVLLWNIEDHISLAATGTRINSSDRCIIPRGTFQGHTDTIKDVQFHPSSSQVFCSVGDDSCLMLWDARVGNAVVKVEKAHDDVINSVDWNRCADNYIITGSADKTVRLFDMRNVSNCGVGSPTKTFQNHKTAVLCVQWCPDKPSLFASSSEDGTLNVWDYKMGRHLASEIEDLYVQHRGHSGGRIVEFQWNEFDPLAIASVSDDFGTSGGVGKLQIWRVPNDWYNIFKKAQAEPSLDTKSDSTTTLSWWPLSRHIQRKPKLSDLETRVQLQEEPTAKDQLTSYESLKKRSQVGADEAKEQPAVMSETLEESGKQISALADSVPPESSQKQHELDSGALSSSKNEIQTDRVTNSEAPLRDLHLPSGPITRAKANKIQEADSVPPEASQKQHELDSAALSSSKNEIQTDRVTDSEAPLRDLHLPSGPITRAKAKKIQEAMHGSGLLVKLLT